MGWLNLPIGVVYQRKQNGSFILNQQCQWRPQGEQESGDTPFMSQGDTGLEGNKSLEGRFKFYTNKQ